MTQMFGRLWKNKYMIILGIWRLPVHGSDTTKLPFSSLHDIFLLTQFG